MGLDARFAKRQCRIGIQDLVDEVLVKVRASAQQWRRLGRVTPGGLVGECSDESSFTELS